MNSNSIVQDQIFFLRHLARLDNDIKISLDGRSRWLSLFDVIQNPPNHPISSRSILRNEIVLELDDDSWETVRNGTKKIVQVLEKWGAKDCYYLSFSGHNSIHVHLFFDPSSLKINDDTLKVLENIDKNEIRKEVKTYIMKQIGCATGTNPDMALANKHLIRLEGSTHEGTGKPCSQINTVPDSRSANYPVKIPDSLPPKLWNISFLENELNIYLKLHFTKKEKPVHYGPGKPIENPERLAEILRPIHIQGHRHHIILALSGLLRRHSVSLSTAQGIIKQLGNKDEELPSRLYNLKEIYKADNSKPLYGLPQLVKIIRKEMEEGKITEQIAKITISRLKNIASKDTLKTVYILRDFKTQWHNRVLDLRKEDLLNTDEKLAMHLQSIGVAKILNKEVQT
ncbi:MAG: hypothetical protein QW292_14105 [Candidatus Parvarchaeota archaeon]